MSALLMVAIAIAIGIALAVAGQSPQGDIHRRPQRRNRSLACEFTDGCRALSGSICMPFEPMPLGSEKQPTQSQDSREMQPRDLPGLVSAASRDAGFLHQRMRALQIDPDEFAGANPTIMGHLTICCVHCGSTAECTRDLSDAWIDLSGEAWRDYCPNAAVLRMICTLRATGMSSLSEPGVPGPSARDDKTAAVTRH
jgi:hypothetical protein